MWKDQAGKVLLLIQIDYKTLNGTGMGDAQKPTLH